MRSRRRLEADRVGLLVPGSEGRNYCLLGVLPLDGFLFWFGVFNTRDGGGDRSVL